MTMRLCAERKTMSAERFSVSLSRRRIHARDCVDCETKDCDIGEITRDFTMKARSPTRPQTADGDRRPVSHAQHADARDQDTMKCLLPPYESTRARDLAVRVEGACQV
jgi:hypothetical protein